MTRPPEFQTTDLDLAAAIMTGTGKQPGAFRQPGQPLVAFEFKDDEATRAIILSYASGDLCQNVKRFAACRAWLYRQAKGVR
ncbi:hypothetical protein [Geobacter pickeringii]|uniref:DUF5659 domain-containing protein n=1 Tax=Geobacter pickeringii TaxID=345632 RepID=A0A0B5BJJ0_9BACT|nr:hypothetical protein [Geobacter pickeringii]AJE04670.1 hypothetical protein GPICK_15995 [Geobacter pickeringii]